ncbi:MAG: hypothetical protein WBW84_09370 [Acidobacteriaceae bacterium]
MRPCCPAALLVLAITFPAATLPLRAQRPPEQHYTWKSVQIVGGGFVDGVIFHPTVAGLRYARTDIGGAYRWDDAAQRWLPLLDWIGATDVNLMGVASIAVDPSDPNRVYLACGTYTSASAPDGAILRSADRGRTFRITHVPFKFGANEDGRGNGERLAVDPRNGRILYVGTRHAGLWRSIDRGVTWSRVASFPDVTEAAAPVKPGTSAPAPGDGIVFVQFAPAPSVSDARRSLSDTRTIYVGVSLMNRPNLYVSSDAGATWKPVPGAPSQYRPTRAALASDGTFYIAYGNAPGPSRMTNGGVWKLDTHSGAWTDITPERPGPGKEFGYAAVAVDAHHPRTVIASTYDHYFGAGENIFRSTDGGATWKPVFGGPHGGVFDSNLAPYVKATPIHWLFDIAIDPTNPDHAVFTTGYGGWETHDLTAVDRGQPTHWSILVPGIEETVALALDSPADVAHLVSGIGDYGGFVHWDLNRSPRAGSSAPPRFGNTTGLASAALHPNILVRVGVSAEHKPGANISYSLDSGRNWHPTPHDPQPNSQAGSIAVSADGTAWIWTPDHAAPSVTRDRGATWTLVQGLSAGTRVVGDPRDPRAFYAFSLFERKLFLSSDDGAHFTAENFTLQNAPPPSHAPRGDPRGGQDQLYATPGRNGDLWIAAFDGLWHADSLAAHNATGAVLFTRLPGVQQIEAFGFGKAAPGRSYPTLYLAGTVEGQPGVFRSNDAGRTWVRINDNQHQWGLILQISGDPRLYGRVYVGTHGRGILYGDPAGRSTAAHPTRK